MLIRIHLKDRVYAIEARLAIGSSRPAGKTVLFINGTGHEYLLTPFAVMCARDGAKGLRLISDTLQKP